MPIITPYLDHGGAHAESAVIANTLAALGVQAPHTGKHYSEALILGIAGGLGAGYLLFDFKEHQEKTLILGWQNRWNMTLDFYANLCARLSIARKIEEGSPTAGLKSLQTAIQNGNPAITWVDRAHLPHHFLPAWRSGYFGHLVVVYGIDQDEALIDDLSARPYRVSLADLSQSRERIGSYKNRIMTLSRPAKVDLERAVREGILDCIDHLSGTSESFAIPVFAKWAKQMTDPKGAKAWNVLFKERIGLYGALVAIFEGVELFSTGGGGMRTLYAEFLKEAAVILDHPHLLEAASYYEELGHRWTAFAQAALPESIEPLRAARSLLQIKHDLLMRKGGEGVKELLPTQQKLDVLAEQYNGQLSLTDQEFTHLLTSLSDRLQDLHKLELEAVQKLRVAIS